MNGEWSLHAVFCASYRDIAIAAIGVVLSWVAIYLWATRERK